MFNTAYEIAQFIIGILGAITTIACFIPQGIKTFLSKDTSGLSKWFFICAAISSLFWLAIGSMAIASPFYLNLGRDAIAPALSSGLPSIITNIITIIVNGVVLIIKLINIRQAKKLGISENEYCNKIKKNKAVNL